MCQQAPVDIDEVRDLDRLTRHGRHRLDQRRNLSLATPASQIATPQALADYRRQGRADKHPIALPHRAVQCNDPPDAKRHAGREVDPQAKTPADQSGQDQEHQTDQGSAYWR